MGCGCAAAGRNATGRRHNSSKSSGCRLAHLSTNPIAQLCRSSCCCAHLLLLPQQHQQTVTPAVIVRQRKPWRRKEGTYIYFEDNAGVIVNPKGEMKGERDKIDWLGGGMKRRVQGGWCWEGLVVWVGGGSAALQLIQQAGDSLSGCSRVCCDTATPPQQPQQQQQLSHTRSISNWQHWPQQLVC